MKRIEKLQIGGKNDQIVISWIFFFFGWMNLWAFFALLGMYIRYVLRLRIRFEP